ncbi:hydrogen gas-evolving membrane-bound hydrogenase subunit E [Aquipuribacter sp. MA13-6]|uniref:hydrogen gas-evolving membrane-bound hydrogenase subunit E n=1 Tax=unclassified Aquipuribacter TaxID=2635084 RepID=UPI003EEE4600
MALVIALLVLASTAVLAHPLSNRLGRDAGYPLGALFLLSLGIISFHAPTVLDGGAVEFERQWIPALNIAFRLHLDGLSLLFAILVLGVGALIMSYCARYLSEEYDHGRLYLLLGAFATAMLGLVLAADMVLLFVFFELTTLASFFLIGGQGLGSAKPATRAFVITATGGLSLLGAVALTASVVGTTNLTEALERSDEIAASPLAPWIAALLILAAFTKSAQLPFHFWLPDAMVALTPVSAYLHAATLVKAGIYVLLRFSPPFAGMPGWTVVLVSVGLATSIVGAVFALQQHDLKALLAYSTVSQLGWIVALIGVGTTASLAVAALHTFAHALFKATLFMLVGIIDREAGSRDIRELQGLYKVMPVTATLTALAALSMAGMPPFLGFVSKEEAYKAFLELPGPWGWVVAGIAVLSAAMTFAYSFRILHGAFGGGTAQASLYEPRASFLAPAAIPAVAGLLLGLTVGALNPLVSRTVQDTLLVETDADLALWHGFEPALYLSALTIALGVVLFLLRAPVDRALHRSLLPFTGVQVYDATYQGALRLGDLVGRNTRSGALAPHLVWPVLSVGALAVVGVLTLGELPVPAAPVTRAGDWLVVGLVAVGVLGMVLTHNRLGAVSMLGVVGFLVAVWFLLAGGVDLALTQTLVEVLTVVVAVLVLRRLPRRFAPTTRRRAVPAALLAVGAGLAAGLATLALTGRREPSPASEVLLNQGEELTGGTNVVNTVLVDFRGLDTFGEILVLAVAGIGLLALLRRDAGPATAVAGTTADAAPSPAPDAVAETEAGDRTIFAVTSRLLVPVILVISFLLLWRGHDEPGGGFIAALVGGLGVALVQIPRGAGARSRLQAVPLLSAGITVAVGAGLLGLLGDSFLQPLKGDLVIGSFTQSFTTSLIFDVGVYLVVVGLVVAAVDRLANGRVVAEAEATQVPPTPAELEAMDEVAR